MEPVDLAFATKRIRQVCESASAARRYLGETVAERLRVRLADLEATERFADLVPSKTRVLSTRPPGQLALILSDGYWLVLAAADDPARIDSKGGIRWESVVRVQILRIEKI